AGIRRFPCKPDRFPSLCVFFSFCLIPFDSILALSGNIPCPMGKEQEPNPPDRLSRTNIFENVFFGPEKDGFRVQNSTCLNLPELWRLISANNRFQAESITAIPSP
ncbi:MAG: hypothetical protein J5944_14450, partial [Lentisphaeria bacterium]|nr:hypothetical protein [Lentisphaeria bacterium]